MNIIAEFSVKSDDVVLKHKLTAALQMIVEIEQVVATMEDRITPHFWATGEGREEFGEAFQDDESATNIAVIDEVEATIGSNRG